MVHFEFEIEMVTQINRLPGSPENLGVCAEIIPQARFACN
jgi:hypothetical protein